MAEKFAVYSDDKDVVDLAQVLSPRKAVTVPWFQLTFTGGTTETIPDAGNAAPEAVDKVVFYETGLSSGSGTRTLKLPETPVDGQIIAIKDVDAGSSNLVIQRFDTSDSIDGAPSYRMTQDRQAILLRPSEVSPGVWAWSILSAYRPLASYLSRWAGTVTAAGDGFYGLGSDSSNTITPALGVDGYDVFPLTQYQTVRFYVSVNMTGLTIGDATIELHMSTVGAIASLGPFTAADSGGYSTDVGVYSPSGSINLHCRVVLANSATGVCYVHAAVEIAP